MATEGNNGATKIEHKDYARSLYLSVDGDGKQKYSYSDIATILNKDFGTNYHRSTVGRWADRGGWDNDFRQMRQHGVAQSREPDKELLDKKARDISNLYEVAKGINIETTSQLWDRLKKGKLSNRELIVLQKQTGEIMLELNETRKGHDMEAYMKLSFTEEEISKIEGEIYIGTGHGFFGEE